jgi:HEAT repeat protein
MSLSARLPRRRASAVAYALVALVALLRASPSAAASVFTLADRSTVVLRGVVERVQSYKREAFLVFTITPREVLKGEVALGSPIALVEERVFGSERPYFAVGGEALVLAVPLPSYSYYRETLPAGSYLRWTDPKESAEDIAALADPAAAAVVSRYLALRTDPPALARYLATVLGSPLRRLRADALATIVAHHDVAAALDADALAPVRTVLGDERLPLTERGHILIELARAGAPGAGTLAEEIAARRGPLEAAAADALVSLKRTPPEGRLLAWSRGDDPALRIAAVRGLAGASSRTAFERIAAIVQHDSAREVRIAALAALGSAHDPRAVPVLAGAMQSDDRDELLAASGSLARIGTPEAIRALGRTLREGSFEAESAAAFALKQSGKADAEAILREQRDLHPDPQVRRVIKLALGEHLEEHEE